MPRRRELPLPPDHDDKLQAARLRYFKRLRRFHRSIGLDDRKGVAIDYIRLDSWELLNEAEAQLQATLSDPDAIERARVSIGKIFSG